MGVGRRGRGKANNLTIRTDARVCGRINKGDMELVEQKGNKTAEINKIGDNFDGVVALIDWQVYLLLRRLYLGELSGGDNRIVLADQASCICLVVEGAGVHLGVSMSRTEITLTPKTGRETEID